MQVLAAEELQYECRSVTWLCVTIWSVLGFGAVMMVGSLLENYGWSWEWAAAVLGGFWLAGLHHLDRWIAMPAKVDVDVEGLKIHLQQARWIHPRTEQRIPWGEMRKFELDEASGGRARIEVQAVGRAFALVGPQLEVEKLYRLAHEKRTGLKWSAAAGS